METGNLYNPLKEEPEFFKAENEPEIDINKDQKEDEQLHQQLASLLGVEEKTALKKYHGLADIIQGSRVHDVSLGVEKWIGGSNDDATKNPENKDKILEITTKLLLRGYEAECLGWLKELAREGLKNGKADRGKMIKEAEKLAGKAGLTIEQVADRNNFDLKEIA